MIINEGDLVSGARVYLDSGWYSGLATFIDTESLEFDGIWAVFQVDEPGLNTSTRSHDNSTVCLRVHYGCEDYGIRIITYINDSIDLEAYYREVLEG